MSELFEEAKSLAVSRVLSEPIDNLPVTEMIQAQYLLKRLSDAVEVRLKELRDPLLATAEAKGEMVGEKGTRRYFVEGSTVTIEYRKNNSPGDKAVLELLKEKGLQITDVFDESKILVFNPSKFDFLLQTGKINQKEYDATIPMPTPALRVYPSDSLKDEVEKLGFKSKPKVDSK